MGGEGDGGRWLGQSTQLGRYWKFQGGRQRKREREMEGGRGDREEEKDVVER